MNFAEKIASKLPKGLVSQEAIANEVEKIGFQIFRAMGYQNLPAKKKICYLLDFDPDFLSDVMIEYKDLQKKLN